MKHKLKDYPKTVRPFVVAYKRKFWSLGGLNSNDSDLLDWNEELKEFANYDTDLMYQMYRVGKRQANKENRIKLMNLFKNKL